MSGASLSYETEIEFFLRREREEYLAAAMANDCCAGQVHRALAKRYAEHVRLLSRSAIPDRARIGGQDVGARRIVEMRVLEIE